MQSNIPVTKLVGVADNLLTVARFSRKNSTTQLSSTGLENRSLSNAIESVPDRRYVDGDFAVVEAFR